jgi:hypothetical protein
MPGSGTEARRNKRKQFSYAGALDVGGGAELLPCEISDISDGGARIVVFTDPNELPDSIALVLSPNGKVRRNCRVAWRSDTEVGLQFIKAPAIVL